MMVRFIHSGDVHLGMKFNSSSFGGVKGRERREELWSTFSQMLQHAKKEAIDLVLITGDLLEGNNITLRDIKRLKDSFAFAKEQKFIISLGNHDMVFRGSVYAEDDWPENVIILGEKGLQHIQFEELGTSIWAMEAKRDKETLLRELGAFKPIKGNQNILMLHGEFGAKVDYPLPDLQFLKELSMDYIALGHIHKPHFLDHGIAYCGSLEPLDFGETGKRGFIEGRLSDASSLRFVPFSKREFNILEFELNSESTIEEVRAEIMEYIGDCGKKNFHRVILKGISPVFFHKDALETSLSKELYYLEMVDDSKPDIDLQVLMDQNKNNILGKYIESFNDEDMENPIVKAALFAGVYALMEGSDLQ